MMVENFICDDCGAEVRGYKQIPYGRVYPPDDWEIVNHGIVMGGNSQSHYCPECKEKRNQRRPILLRQFKSTIDFNMNDKTDINFNLEKDKL